MAEDIVERLQAYASDVQRDCYDDGDLLNEAAAEIKRLRKALELTCRDESAESWDLLMLHYLKEARRG